MADALMSFVVATYRRVDALSCTLRALQLQRNPDWTAIVVGDCCGPETAEAIHRVNDPRIRYYNLPERYGEQSGPNSVGLSLVRSEFVGFLNHDDLLLADHIDQAIDRLRDREAHFDISLGANATRLQAGEEGEVTPIFTEVLPTHHDLGVLVSPDAYSFDPSSFWTIRTDYARAIGPWHPAVRLWRTPLRDWLMRAWRAGGRFSFGDAITGLRFWTQNVRKEGLLYGLATPEHEHMLTILQCQSPDAVRALLAQQIDAHRRHTVHTPGSPRVHGESQWRRMWRWQTDRARRLAAIQLYLRLGVDAFSLGARLRGVRPGELMQGITRRRVGASLAEPPSLDAVYRKPEAYRVI